MKKIGLLLVVFASLGVVGCSSDNSCEELSALWHECCDRMIYESNRNNCKAVADFIATADECSSEGFVCGVQERDP